MKKERSIFNSRGREQIRNKTEYRFLNLSLDSRRVRKHRSRHSIFQLIHEDGMIKLLIFVQFLAFIFWCQSAPLYAQSFFCMPREEIDQVVIAEESLQIHLRKNNTIAACVDLENIIHHLKNTEANYRRCGQNAIARNLQLVADGYMTRMKNRCR
jgi:hypothetical protein